MNEDAVNPSRFSQLCGEQKCEERIKQVPAVPFQLHLGPRENLHGILPYVFQKTSHVGNILSNERNNKNVLEEGIWWPSRYDNKMQLIPSPKTHDLCNLH